MKKKLVGWVGDWCPICLEFRTKALGSCTTNMLESFRGHQSIGDLLECDTCGTLELASRFEFVGVLPKHPQNWAEAAEACSPAMLDHIADIRESRDKVIEMQTGSLQRLDLIDGVFRRTNDAALLENHIVTASGIRSLWASVQAVCFGGAGLVLVTHSFHKWDPVAVGLLLAGLAGGLACLALAAGPHSIVSKHYLPKKSRIRMVDALVKACVKARATDAEVDAVVSRTKSLDLQLWKFINADLLKNRVTEHRAQLMRDGSYTDRDTASTPALRTAA